ncbi:quinate 5-dehydrogenase [Desulforudis sp. DRI-14]|uniref:quinate 5-dehydrogenase n=1 Tax=Desulforudis sp. DRI-14 TaxID=3459793 RepID=UPI004040EF0C
MSLRKVVSVSLGSSKRNKTVQAELLGQQFEISRIGTDGDFGKALATLRELDGKVDAIGLGGIDVFLYVGEREYAIRDGLRLMRAVKKTPVVDGSGLKWTLEREVVHHLARETDILPPATRVLMVSATDRFGMAQAFIDVGCETVFGDLIFVLGVPFRIRTIRQLSILARLLLPFISKLPFRLLYPTGKKQDIQDEKKARKFAPFFEGMDVIAGDWHLVRKYLPLDLKGKIIITNTTTKADVDLLRERGAGYLVTTTPEFDGRSFGTNVLEGVFVALIGKPWREIPREEYMALLKKLNFKPRIVRLNQPRDNTSLSG